jgi:hypothetical protein
VKNVVKKKVEEVSKTDQKKIVFPSSMIKLVTSTDGEKTAGGKKVQPMFFGLKKQKSAAV